MRPLRFDGGGELGGRARCRFHGRVVFFRSRRVRAVKREKQIEKFSRVRKALFAVDLRHRPPLDLVSVEKRFACLSLQNGGKFPGEVLRVDGAGVEPETACRREAVRGIARQKDTAFAVALRDLRRHRPGTDVISVAAAHADGRLDEFAAARVSKLAPSASGS